MDDYARIEAALLRIERDARRQPSLEELAASAGLSPAHFQRVFTRWAGISPKRFLQAVTVGRARELLRRSRSVLDVALDVGLSGPGRLHDLTVTCEAMTPGQIGRLADGVTIRHAIVPSPLGPVFVARTDRGVCAVEFVASGEDPAPGLQRHWPGAALVAAADDEAVPWGAAIFGNGPRPPLALHLRGTNFQIQVWRALLRIPSGRIVDYGALAEAVGRPGAARAVGAAVGANPVAVLVPCHRVLRRHGQLGGYRWGTGRKLALLGRELARGSDGGGASRS
ncbi:MAG TPA: methylated-DNA--[protein]-cysteine S-methyltransferase [Candidatus Krumholzibacteria bacterium]|nr:methylated-DNA--[protein]-cysteine S-methyltransferase [Candidatus Krumholzibacteria bacterium]